MKTAINVSVLVDPGNTPLGLHLVFPICRLFMFRLQSFLYIPFHKKGTFSPLFVISTSSHVSFFFVLRHFPLLLRFLLISFSSSLEKILFVFFPPTNTYKFLASEGSNKPKAEAALYFYCSGITSPTQQPRWKMFHHFFFVSNKKFPHIPSTLPFSLFVILPFTHFITLTPVPLHTLTHHSISLTTHSTRHGSQSMVDDENFNKFITWAFLGTFPLNNNKI